jgi:hypothetical protein
VLKNLRVCDILEGDQVESVVFAIYFLFFSPLRGERQESSYRCLVRVGSARRDREHWRDTALVNCCPINGCVGAGCEVDVPAAAAARQHLLVLLVPWPAVAR